MDQSATNRPHLKKVSNSTVNLWHLRTHLTGAITHGHGSEEFLDFLQYPQDPQSHDKCCTTFVSIQITIPILSTKEAVYSNG